MPAVVRPPATHFHLARKQINSRSPSGHADLNVSISFPPLLIYVLRGRSYAIPLRARVTSRAIRPQAGESTGLARRLAIFPPTHIRNARETTRTIFINPKENSL